MGGCASVTWERGPTWQRLPVNKEAVPRQGAYYSPQRTVPYQYDLLATTDRPELHYDAYGQPPRMAPHATGNCGPFGICGSGLSPKPCLCLVALALVSMLCTVTALSARYGRLSRLAPAGIGEKLRQGIETTEQESNQFFQEAKQLIAGPAATLPPPSAGAPPAAKAAAAAAGAAASFEEAQLQQLRGTPTASAAAPFSSAPQGVPVHHKYDCSVGLGTRERSWPRKKKDWCCLHGGIGCPVDRKPIPYDCQTDGQDWQTWSSGRQDWCCGYSRKGCSMIGAHQVVTDSTMSPTNQAHQTAVKHGSSSHEDHRDAGLAAPSVSFDCGTADAHAPLGWSVGQKAWCCLVAGRGCPPDVPSPNVTLTGIAGAAGDTASVSPLTAGDDLFAATIPAPTGGTEHPCQAPCRLHGTTASCSARMAWAAGHLFADMDMNQSCAAAHGLVFGSCDACRQCSLRQAIDACLGEAS